jgi:hypothetical protein
MGRNFTDFEDHQSSGHNLEEAARIVDLANCILEEVVMDSLVEVIMDNPMEAIMDNLMEVVEQNQVTTRCLGTFLVATSMEVDLMEEAYSQTGFITTIVVGAIENHFLLGLLNLRKQEVNLQKSLMDHLGRIMQTPDAIKDFVPTESSYSEAYLP